MTTINTYFHLFTSQPLISGFSCCISTEASPKTQVTLWPLILLMSAFFLKLFPLWFVWDNAFWVPLLPVYLFLCIWSRSCFCIPILQMRKIRSWGWYFPKGVTELALRQLDVELNVHDPCAMLLPLSPDTFSLSSLTHGLGRHFTLALIILKSILAGQLCLQNSKPVHKAC